MFFWVVGANGMLGSSFCKLFKEKKIPFFSTSKGEADITDFSSLQKIYLEKKPTHIINCAAYTNVEKSEEDGETAFLVNERGIGNLAEIVQGKLVHFSTDYVFDGRKKTPYFETDIPCPINVYGESKLAGERVLFKRKPDALCIRISWLFGGQDDFVSKMTRLMQQKKVLKVVDDQIGCPSFSDDVALFTFEMLSEEGIFHFIQGEQTSWYGFAREIFSLLNKKKSLLCTKIEPIDTKNFVTKAKRPLYSVLGSSKIQSRIKSTQTWQRALEEFING